MSERQWKRLDAVAAVEQGIRSYVGAAARLGGYQRAGCGGCGGEWRSWVAQRWCTATPGAPKHRLSAEQRERIVELRLGQYRGFNNQHFTDKLGEVEQLEARGR